jgi:hypothetical protein
MGASGSTGDERPGEKEKTDDDEWPEIARAGGER